MRLRQWICAVLCSVLMGHASIASADYFVGFRAFQLGDVEIAVAQWEPLADAGDIDSQNSLGALYKFGLGVPKNGAAAVKYYQLSADQGDAAGQYGLATMYASGEGVEQSDEKALSWFTLAAKQGDEDAQYNLGLIYQQGKGVLKNDKSAFEWFYKAATQGLPEAQVRLGLMYKNGTGVAQNPDKAYVWLNIGAYGGDLLGIESKRALDEDLSLEERTTLQMFSNRCLSTNYQDC